MKSVTVLNPLNNEKIEAERIVDGIIVLSKNNKKGGKVYGSIAFESMGLSLTGFANENKRVAFLPGEVSTLKKVVTAYNLEAGGQLQGHEIVIKEKTTKFWDTQEPKMGKTNPDSDIFDKVMTNNGNPIYRKYFLVPEGSDVDGMLVNDTVASEVASEIEKMVAASNEVQ